MADSQDKLTPSDEAKLAALEKQLAIEKTASPSAKKEQAATANKRVEKPATKPAEILADQTSYKSSKSTTSSAPRKSTTGSKGKTGVLWFFTLVNLLVLVAIIGAGYWTWLQWQAQNQQQSDILAAQQASMSQQQKNIEQSIASNQLAKGDLEQQNQALQSSISSLVEQLQLTSAEVQTNQRNLADVSGRRPADWLLAEADYLVRMAGRKLWLEHDVKTAIMMLQSADSRLQDLDDSSLLPLRARLAEDLQTLQQLNQVSTSSIALALGAMLKQVDNLPLAFFKKPEDKTVDEAVTESIVDWRANLAHNWNEFTKNFFSVERVTTDIKPFMSEQQQWLSKEQLKFALMQAQVAVLQENSTLYQQSLQIAFGLLIESFDTEKDMVVQFTDSLSNLQLTDFERTYPEQFKVAPLLRDIIEQRLNSRFVNGNN
ncbi:MAG: uroporphyrin-3 C-methyltransferase [Reinekea sp.]|jgi:uroporphyrin-3 C-methyltransferase|uniref:uroporphyrinogen-III C-methyltransferase n=1 Tax=Reinekea sp. TaxID=1970455 RepID=UPI003989ED2E